MEVGSRAAEGSGGLRISVTQYLRKSCVTALLIAVTFGGVLLLLGVVLRGFWAWKAAFSLESRHS